QALRNSSQTRTSEFTRTSNEPPSASEISIRRGTLQPVGTDHGLELLMMGGGPQDSLNSGQQIEEGERRRDDHDEAGQDHYFPQSSCQYCQERSNTRNCLAPAECPRMPWLGKQFKDSHQGRQWHGGSGTVSPLLG